MSESLEAVRRYHQATKHGTQGYAPSPGFLDWDTQPDPFRRFAGAPLVPLPLIGGVGLCPYDALYRPPAEPATLSLQGLGLMFELALGLSAWKSAGPDRWALRSNPSSGNLHPTEGYLLLWRPAAPQLPPGLYHYAPREHALEQRALIPAATAQALAEAHPESFGALGLSSIIWREEWKYGSRAFRYCQHDVGHALAAARLAAAVQGWRLCADPAAGDDAIATCLGLDRSEDFTDAEPEHPDLLALLGGPVLAENTPDWSALAASLQQWQGRANRLSSERVRWPQIAQVLPALHKAGGEVARIDRPPLPPAAACNRPSSDACTLIRQRRSAQRMDGVSPIGRADFELALQRTLPSGDSAPFDAFPYSTAVNLLLEVHAVEGLEPGLYALIRNPETFEDFRATCGNSALVWEPLNDTALPLYRLHAPLDLRKVASQIGCFQGIVGKGAYAVAMLADFGVLSREGAWAYRRLYWETGLIGQVLYLEAEAAGLRGTGIGCFFDDEIHRLLGIDATDTGGVAAWQALYQFTVGGPIVDQRLTTEPPYAHLERARQ